MKKVDKFIELINSKKVVKRIDKCFEEDKKILFKKVRNKRLYEACMKAAILSDYLLKTEDIAENAMIKRLEDGSIFNEYFDVPYTMNAFVSNVGDYIKKLRKDDVEILFSYEEDDALPFLDDREEEIIENIKSEMNIYTFDELMNGLYKKKKGFDGNNITIEELKKINYVKMIPGIINHIHLLYDDFGENEDDITCAYSEIREKSLKPFAFHTSTNRPDRNILFDDDTILYYSQGDFRFLPYLFSDIVYIVKLRMIDIYRNGTDDDETDVILRDLANNEELSEIPIEEMNPTLFEHLVIFALSDIYEQIFESVNFQYSRKMIEDSTKKMENYKDLTLRYKL